MEWISVANQLPKPYISVIVHIPKESPFPAVREGFIAENGSWCIPALFDFAEVTHWMPMPAPPKELSDSPHSGRKEQDNG